MFIGRKDEQAFLNSCYDKKGGQLVVLYGRRRVGKTETLRQFCKDKPHVFYSCRECTDSEQLTSFSKRMLTGDIPASKYLSRFSDWEQALAAIVELPSGDNKKLLIIDEFPYMVHGNRSIPSILQNLWDDKLRNENIMLVLCGSAMSFIKKGILAEKNPLYGRATGILKMTEMGFYDAIQFFPNYNEQDKIATYAVLGGIPHYLQQFDDGVSLNENICENILRRGSILYSEIEFLMRQELRETAIYNTIVEAVALGNTKLNEIFLKTQIEKAKLSVYLKNLMELEIIRREFPVVTGDKSKANIQRGFYNLTDNFFRFWYQFVFPNTSELEAGDVDGVFDYMVAPNFDFFVSKAFEDVCIAWLREQNWQNTLPLRFSKIGRYWKGDVEIDILAAPAHAKQYLFGECKYKNSPLDLGEYEKAMQKCTAFDGKKYCYFFSKSGFTTAVKEKATQDANINLISLEEIFI